MADADELGDASPDRKRSYHEDDEPDPDAARHKRQARGDDAPAETDMAVDAPAETDDGDAAEDADRSRSRSRSRDGDGGEDGPDPLVTMRALISTKEAGVVIGRSGKNINDVRDQSGAKVNVSEQVPGAGERVVTVSGPLRNVAKAFSLVVQKVAEEQINDELRANVAGVNEDIKTRHCTIRLLVPHARMGGVIGKQGSKIKDIQDRSGCRISASEEILPNSSERLVTLSGVPDAIHIASYHIGSVVHDGDGRAAQATILYRPTASRGSSYGDSSYSGRSSHRDHSSGQSYSSSSRTAPAPSGSSLATQQIFIPNDMVGAIIGKGGSKINEIRQQSGCQIKIADSQDNAAERLVTITGSNDAVQMALYLLYSRMEAEKQRQSE
ncbi:KH domain RNA-binding protein [Hyaloraphidium curvatum]|nr:KH domain RNA-binding protein [Hyaloraphidium curvatum]